MRLSRGLVLLAVVALAPMGATAAYFPGGAPPSTSPAQCLAKCDEWAASSFVKDVGTAYGGLGVTKVTGTCYLQGKPIAPPRALSK